MAGETPHSVNFFNSRAGELKGPPPPNTSAPYPLYVAPEPNLNGVAHASRPSFRSTPYIDPNDSPVSPRTQQPESTTWAHQQRSPMDHRTALEPPIVQRESPDFRHLHSPTAFTRSPNVHSTYASPSAPSLRDREDFSSDRMLQHPAALQPPIQADFQSKGFPLLQDYSYSQPGGTSPYPRAVSSVAGEFSRPFAPPFDSRNQLLNHIGYPPQLERRHTAPHHPGLSIHADQRRESHTPSSSTAISPPQGYGRLSSGQHSNYIPISDSRNTNYRLNTSPNDGSPIHHNDPISNAPHRQPEFFPRQPPGVLEQGGMNRVMNGNYNPQSQPFSITSKQVATEAYEPPNKRVKTEEHGGSAAPSTGEVSDQDTEDEGMFGVGSRPGSGTPDAKKRKYSTKSSRSSVHRNRSTARLNQEDIDEDELPAYIDGVPVNREWGLTKAGKARQRLPQACIACRKKKIKCIISKGQTICEKCKQQNMLCEFKSSTSSRGKAMAENEEDQTTISEDLQTAELASHSMIEDHEMSGSSSLKREKDMEVLNMNYISTIEPARPSTFMKGEGSTQVVQPIVTPSAPLFVADPMNADLASASRISTSARLAEVSRDVHVRDMAAQWSGSMSRPRHSSAGVSATLSSPPSPISTETWQHTPNKRYYASTRSRSTPIRGTPASSVPGPIGEDPRDFQLPPPDVLEHLCGLYFTHIFSQHYPFLHRETFMANLENHRTVLLYSLCAATARFSQRHRDAEEEFAQRARQLILENFAEQKLEVVQAMVVMGLHDFGSGNGQKAWMFCGMAVRLGAAMNLNMEPKKEKGQSPVEIEVQRRTYWSYYLMDRLNSYGNSRPFLTQDHDCHIQLPCDQTSFNNNIPVTTELLNGKKPCPPHRGNQNMGVFAYLIRIVSLWGDVLKYLHLSVVSRDAEPTPTKFEPDPEFKKFVIRLQEWKDSLPSELRYSRENLGGQISDGTVGTFVMMHVMFHTCSVYVYRHVTTVTIPKSPEGYKTQDVPKGYILDSIQKIFFHADSVMQIMEQVWQRKREAEKSGGESVTVVAPFIGQAVLDASLIGIRRARHRKKGVEVVERVEKALLWLEELKKYWRPVEAMYDKLRKAYKQMKGRTGATKFPPESSSGTGSSSVSPKQIAPFEHSFIPSPTSQQLHQLHTAMSHNALEFPYDPDFPGDLLHLPEWVYDVYFNDSFSGQGTLNHLAEYGMNPEYPGQGGGDIDQQPPQQHPISTLNSTIISQSPSMTNTSTSSIQAQNPYSDHHISENNMATSPEQPSTLLSSDIPAAPSPPHSADDSDDDCDDEHDENEEEKPEDFGHQYFKPQTPINRMGILHCLNEDKEDEDVRKVVEASEKNILEDNTDGESQSGCIGERKYSRQYTPDGGFATGAEAVEAGG